MIDCINLHFSVVDQGLDGQTQSELPVHYTLSYTEFHRAKIGARTTAGILACVGHFSLPKTVDSQDLECTLLGTSLILTHTLDGVGLYQSSIVIWPAFPLNLQV